MNNGIKRLRRSKTDRIIAGVIGGFGEYLGVDSTLLRVIFVFFVLVTGFFPGVLAYIIAIFLIPLEGEPVVHTIHNDAQS